MAKNIFVVSTGRTATDALSGYIDSHVESVTSRHEPSPSFARQAPALITRRHRRTERLYLGATRASKQLFSSKSVYIEFNHRLFSSLDLIRRTFKDAHIIHIVRDGRDTVRSWLNKGRYIQSDNFMTPNDVPGSGVAYEEWLSWSPIKKNAWAWSLVNGVIASQGPDHVVRFEDIFDSEQNALASVLHDIAPDVFDAERLFIPDAKPTHRTKEYVHPRFEDWPKSDQEDFWTVAGAQMNLYGYHQK